MSVDTLVAAPVKLPRVNLLPQEINEANAARRVKFGLASVVVAAVGVVGVLYTGASGSAAAAQVELDDATATTAKLQADVRAHGSAKPVKDEVKQRRDKLKLAMRQNIPWAFYLNDVQLVLPRGARLLTWQLKIEAPAAGSANAAFSTGGEALWTITGEARRYEDVALVIEALEQLDEVDSVFATTAEWKEDPVSKRMIVAYSLTSRMNEKALAEYAPEVGN